MNILITGGLGYIGCHVVRELIKLDHKVFIIDDASTGDIRLVSNLEPISNITVQCDDYSDTSALDNLIGNSKIDLAIHLAAYIKVEESVKSPSKYYENNVVKMKKFLDYLINHNISKIIFASSAAVYDNNGGEKFESSNLIPINPYGWSKLIGEQLIKDYSKSYGLNYVIFRFFNVCGASLDSLIGEPYSNNPSHLITILIDSILNNKKMKVFGNDYPTSDGSCVRDFIHVVDIANAIVKAIEYDKNNIFNLGTGCGYSVLKIINKAKEKWNFDYEIVGRRSGDPAELYANACKAYKELKWHPEYSDLDIILDTQMNWLKKLISK